MIFFETNDLLCHPLWGRNRKIQMFYLYTTLTDLCTFGSVECYLASLKTCSDMQGICIVTTQGMQAMKIFINQVKIDNRQSHLRQLTSGNNSLSTLNL